MEGRIKKLIFFENAVETLGYFSRELAQAFDDWGYSSYFVDYNDLYDGMKRVTKFAKAGVTALITFNFIGLSGEEFCREKDGRSMWESRDIPCFCILVDHPLYYHKQLDHPHRGLTVFCVDRQHVEYMERFYPEVDCQFLPLAGNMLLKEKVSASIEDPMKIKYANRPYDVAFIANFVPLPGLKEHFKSLSQEYIDFYYEIIDDLIAHPNQRLDTTMERFIKREIPEATEDELKAAFAGMLFLDLYIRTYYRQLTVRTLVDAGIKVHVFGKDWEQLECEHPENLIQNGEQITSAECVEVIRNTKIALNTMPWFKDGAHDRIFTAMLNGAVPLTDTSIYLTEELEDGENVCFYTLEKIEQLPQIVRELLDDRECAEQIVKNGYAYAQAHHTWQQRANTIRAFFRNME